MKGLFHQKFEINTRDSRLQDRLQQYYDETPDSMSNKDAMVKWREFKEWCRIEGYTPEEINKAKQARCYRFN